MRKVVWIIGDLKSEYLDAAPVLAVKGVDLVVLRPSDAVQSLGPRRSLTPSPNLIITTESQLPECRRLTKGLPEMPEIWETRSDGADVSAYPGARVVPVFKSATDLIARLSPPPAPKVEMISDPQPGKSRRLAVLIAGRKTELTVRECSILKTIADAPGAACHGDDIRRNIWRDAKVCSKTLDVHISNIRKKLRPLGADIEFRPPGVLALVFTAPRTSEPPVVIQQGHYFQELVKKHRTA